MEIYLQLQYLEKYENHITKRHAIIDRMQILTNIYE
jgi:hypothetical protein